MRSLSSTTSLKASAISPLTPRWPRGSRTEKSPRRKARSAERSSPVSIASTSCVRRPLARGAARAVLAGGAADGRGARSVFVMDFPGPNHSRERRSECETPAIGAFPTLLQIQEYTPHSAMLTPEGFAPVPSVRRAGGPLRPFIHGAISRPDALQDVAGCEGFGDQLPALDAKPLKLRGLPGDIDNVHIWVERARPAGDVESRGALAQVDIGDQNRKAAGLLGEDRIGRAIVARTADR